jgi:hypothetical protein
MKTKLSWIIMGFIVIPVMGQTTNEHFPRHNDLKNFKTIESKESINPLPESYQEINSIVVSPGNLKSAKAFSQVADSARSEDYDTITSSWIPATRIIYTNNDLGYPTSVTNYFSPSNTEDWKPYLKSDF